MFPVERLFDEPQTSPAMVVAEIGINHNGDAGFARELIDLAVESGASAVKFQVFKTEKFYNPKLMPEMVELFKKYELSYDDFEKIKAYADNKGIIFFATPLDMDSIDFLIDMNTPMIKIASSDITTEPFLAKIAKSGRKVLLSTGFVEKPEIERAVKIIRDIGRDDRQLGLLYCVSKYPAESSDFDLNFIPVLRREFSAVTGFSDHSMDNSLSIAAVALGAKIIERHFTSDRNLHGGDHSMSLSPSMFSALVDSIRDVEAALGTGRKKVTEFESVIRNKSMRSIYSIRGIKKDEIISEADIALMRPGSGIRLDRYLSLIGNKMDKDFDIHEDI